MAQICARYGALALLCLAALAASVNAQCCPDGSTPNCAAGSFQPGPPPACSGGGSPTCDNGSVGPEQPCDGGGGGGDSGSVSADTCSPASNTECATDGSSNYNSKSSWTYDSATGKFSGVITTNLCSNNAYGICDLCTGAYTIMKHRADCIAQTIPAPAYDGNTATASPLRGRVGLTLEGVNIYGPMEAGFYAGQASCSDGSCAAGLDVPACETQLEYQCPSATTTGVKYEMMLDTCGGHAMPYHYHLDPVCDYSQSSAGHSPLVGVALDGYGIYGVNEATGTPPSDLDACGGHTHTVPANAGEGVASTSVYHYHAQGGPPYTLGCYGPVDSLDACKALYPSCNDGYELIYGSSTTGTYKDLYDARNLRCYDSDCPCFDSNGANTALTSDECPVSAASTVVATAAVAVAFLASAVVSVATATM